MNQSAEPNGGNSNNVQCRGVWISLQPVGGFVNSSLNQLISELSKKLWELICLLGKNPYKTFLFADIRLSCSPIAWRTPLAKRVSSLLRSERGMSRKTELKVSASSDDLCMASASTSCLLEKCLYRPPDPGERPAASSISAMVVPRYPLAAKSRMASFTILCRVGVAGAVADLLTASIYLPRHSGTGQLDNYGLSFLSYALVTLGEADERRSHGCACKTLGPSS